MQTDNLNPAAGGIPAVRVYRANGMFDPEVTGAGHQPRGFDQLMALYDHFVVISCKVTCRFAWELEAEAAVYNPMAVGIALQSGTSPLIGSGFDYQEDGYANWKVITANESNEVVVTNKFDVSFLGKRTWSGDPELEGSASADPAEQAFFHIFGTPLTTNDLPNCKFTILLEYTAMLIEPVLPGAS